MDRPERDARRRAYLILAGSDDPEVRALAPAILASNERRRLRDDAWRAAAAMLDGVRNRAPLLLAIAEGQPAAAGRVEAIEERLIELGELHARVMDAVRLSRRVPSLSSIQRAVGERR
jgi:hypothetical protein